MKLFPYTEQKKQRKNYTIGYIYQKNRMIKIQNLLLLQYTRKSRYSQLNAKHGEEKSIKIQHLKLKISKKLKTDSE